MRDPAAGTNWRALPVDQIWSMIESHDGNALYPLINGWRRSFELVLQHLSDVKRYRASLAAAWPPDRSPAARAYLERLDALIKSLEETYEAATMNHRAFTMATSALDTARRTMAEIHQEHTANEALLATHREQLRLHHLVGGKARGMPPQSPVPLGRQAELERRAQTLMTGLSAELAEAQIALITPRPYTNPNMVNTRDDELVNKTAYGYRQYVESFDSRVGASIHPPSAVSDRNSPTETQSRGTPGNPSAPGPTLQESAPPPAGNSAIPADNHISEKPSATHTWPSVIAAHPSPTKPNRQVFKPNGQAPPSGHVIGGNSHSEQIRPAPTIQRVNPIGGVIGGGYPAAPPTQNAGRRTGEARSRNVDTQWGVAEGIDPILLPPEVKPIDPGPAIGLPPR
jgi:hypothetical protein